MSSPSLDPSYFTFSFDPCHLSPISYALMQLGNSFELKIFSHDKQYLEFVEYLRNLPEWENIKSNNDGIHFILKLSKNNKFNKYYLEDIYFILLNDTNIVCKYTLYKSDRICNIVAHRSDTESYSTYSYIKYNEFALRLYDTMSGIVNNFNDLTFVKKIH